MTTTIISNGSKWAGEAPDSVEDLLKVLEDNALDPRFEDFGNFVYEPDSNGVTRFFGNFFSLSHVFNLDTDEPETIKALTEAIKKNQDSEAYKEARDNWAGCEKCGGLTICTCDPQYTQNLYPNWKVYLLIAPSLSLGLSQPLGMHTKTRLDSLSQFNHQPGPRQTSGGKGQHEHPRHERRYP